MAVTNFAGSWRRTPRRARALAEHCLRTLYPPTCAGCERRCRQPGFCTSCRDAILPLAAAICPLCGRPFAATPNHLCEACIRHQRTFDRARACASYSAAAQEAPLVNALYALKYRRDVRFAKPLARLLALRAPRDRCYDAVVPVPLHLDRLRWRGFNQALLLVQPWARATGTTIAHDALRRTRPTSPQVELSERERRRNVRGAFDVTTGWPAHGKRVLLVDDVFTTGATVEECARVLRSHGAAGVDVLTLARAR